MSFWQTHYSAGMHPLMPTVQPGSAKGKPHSSITSSYVGIIVLLIISLAFGAISYEVYELSRGKTTPVTSNTFAASNKQHITSRKQLTKKQNFPAPHLQNLILVACHSVFMGLDFKHAEEASSWYLLDYQKDGAEHSFLEHIRLGVQLAGADKSSMLLFSGGKTRKDAGPRAEALGYWMVAEGSSWYGLDSVRDRAYTEEHARDSFENLLFSLCRFYELTGHYPSSITVVSYDFKEERFRSSHRAAVRWPEQRFSFVGTTAPNNGAAEGEEKTLQAFDKDPYGCLGELQDKKILRDPFAVGGMPSESCLDLSELLQYCGPQIFTGALPWDF